MGRNHISVVYHVTHHFIYFGRCDAWATMKWHNVKIDSEYGPLSVGIYESEDGEWQLQRIDPTPEWREWTLCRRTYDELRGDYWFSDYVVKSNEPHASGGYSWRTLNEAKVEASNIIAELSNDSPGPQKKKETMNLSGTSQ